MADIKVSELTEATDTTATDKFMIVQGGATKSIRLSTLLAKLKSNLAIVIDLVTTDFYVKNATYKILNVLSSGYVGIRNDTPLEALHVNGNIKVGKTGVAGVDGIFVGSSEVMNYIVTPAVAVALSASREISELMVNGTSTFTLGAGVDGQTKVLVVKQVAGDGPKAVITIATGVSFNTITLSAVGGACDLRFIDGKWYVVGMSPNGAQISTV